MPPASCYDKPRRERLQWSAAPIPGDIPGAKSGFFLPQGVDFLGLLQGFSNGGLRDDPFPVRTVALSECRVNEPPNAKLQTAATRQSHGGRRAKRPKPPYDFT